MRQNQHNSNKRSRGRNRKGPNPLSRNYESNGPDVKVRGNAAHIAEKYSSLARDALVSGDRVMAENYLQHAEHYNRILAAAQAQMQPAEQPSQQSDSGGYDSSDDDQDDMIETGNGHAPEHVEAQEPIAAQDSDGDQDQTDEKPRTVRARRPRRGPRVKADGSDMDRDAAPAGPTSEEAAAAG